MGKDYYSLYLKYKTKYTNLKCALENSTEKKNDVKMVSVFQNGGADEKKDVMLFKAEWCGHCVGFKGHWNKLQKDHKKDFNFITYDSDKNKKEMEAWGIQGFPTIIVKKGDEAMEYVGPNEYNSVLEFIKNI